MVFRFERRVSAAVFAFILAGCSDPPPPSGLDAARIDGGASVDAGPMCAVECDDGLFCTGREVCNPADPSADEDGCVANGSPCDLEQICVESADECTTPCDPPIGGDADGDGAVAVSCGGLDCDDADPNRRPGAAEFCDADDHDEDCDPTTYGLRDVDGDDEIDRACCNVDAAGVATCGSDCDDARASIGPTSPEVCNGRDDDCDALTDEEVLNVFYLDADRDGYGDDSAPTMMACTAPAMYVDQAGDCDDTTMAVHSGAPEICGVEEVDENCDGEINEGCACAGTETRECSLLGLCASGTESCIAGTWGMCSIMPVIEECNGVDDDCDGTVDDGVRVTCYADADNDTYAASGAAAISQCPVGGRTAVGGCPVNYTNRPPVAPGDDCNDSDSTIAPGSVEACNMRDDDCDGSIDDGVGIVCYADGDRDGYASMSAPGTLLCPVSGGCPFGFTTRMPAGATTSDCNDAIMTTFPGALEACDGVDNDCSGMIDDGMRVTCWNDGDDDGYPPMGAASMTFCPDASRPSVGGCPSNRTNRDPATVANRDCNDANRDIRPGATELCDGVDNDCNGSDDAMRVRCWFDGDIDGYAPSGATASMECPDPARMAVGFCPVNRTNRDPATMGNADCDDSNPGFSPGVMEMCSVPAVDQNCNGTGDEGIVSCFADADRDGFAPTGAAMLAPACPIAGGYGGCGVGYTSRDPATAGNADCDDAAVAVNPLGSETCNSVDDNCNGTMDEGFYIDRMYYRDRDRDLHGVGSLTTRSWPSCATEPPPGYADVNDDCCDTERSAYPGAQGYLGRTRTACGGYDFNCDGVETIMPSFPMMCNHMLCSTIGCAASLDGVFVRTGVCTAAAACGVMTAGCECTPFGCGPPYCTGRVMTGTMVPQPCR